MLMIKQLILGNDLIHIDWTNGESDDYGYNEIIDLRIKQLKECPRLHHSLDMPLVRPQRNCPFRTFRSGISGKALCGGMPSLFKYLDYNNIKWSMGSKFLCILQDGVNQ